MVARIAMGESQDSIPSFNKIRSGPAVVAARIDLHKQEQMTVIDKQTEAVRWE